MKDEVRRVIEYRLTRARRTLDAAELLLQRGFLEEASSRIYYGAFYAVVALLGTRGLRSSRHSGVIALFHQEFVKPGAFPRELAKALDRAFDSRLGGDYADFVRFEPEELAELLAQARAFVAKVEELVSKAG
ncbi:MAG: HEPN domain-containing protein [bacterium]